MDSEMLEIRKKYCTKITHLQIKKDLAFNKL